MNDEARKIQKCLIDSDIHKLITLKMLKKVHEFIIYDIHQLNPRKQSAFYFYPFYGEIEVCIKEHRSIRFLKD
ncbi:MAG: hypothetical protein DRR00_24335 [Candidatus Parabeggiatoa sp. nov. 3]|jgi:hypothetical protein|nr:MAG: hypothetical protein DRR00_24335 [Gammaproteobacteria bacterium]RKZ61093.1 MAG: hypothetical protein DRQ99_21020 [Gammaproteobacteria bacterium]